MRGQQERTGPLFSYISTEDRIPTSHPLRQVRPLADQSLDRLNPTFCQLYREGGRPSIPPEQLLFALLLQGLSRSAAAAPELLGHFFGGIVVSVRFSANNHLPIQQRQLCWAHLIRDLRAIAERPGASSEFGSELLDLQEQLFDHWYRYKGGSIYRAALQQCCRPIRSAFEAVLQQMMQLGCERGDRMPWARTVRTYQQLLQRSEALWTFLNIQVSSPPTAQPSVLCANP